jgi:hypothetical protein
MAAVTRIHMPAMAISLALYSRISLGYNVTWHQIPQPFNQGMLQIDAADLETGGLFSRQHIRQQLPYFFFAQLGVFVRARISSGSTTAAPDEVTIAFAFLAAGFLAINHLFG